MRLKTKILNKVAKSCFNIGLDKLHLKLVAPRCIILCYHGVTKEYYHGYPARHLPFKDFKKQILYLKERFDFLPPSEIADMIRAGIKPRKPTIGLTFDDGCMNNFTEVLPFLESLKIPSTFFVSTIGLHQDNIQKTRVIPWYYIDIINAKCKLKTFRVGERQYLRQGELYFNKKTGDSIYSDFKKLVPSNLNEYLNELKKATKIEKILSEIPLDYYQLAPLEMLQQNSKSPYLEIGAHTIHHFDLTTLNENDLESELIKPKERLEDLLDTEILSLAYPFGSYNNIVHKKAITLGYKYLYIAEKYKADSFSKKSQIFRFCVSHTSSSISNLARLHLSYSKN